MGPLGRCSAFGLIKGRGGGGGAPVHERARVEVRADYIKSLISVCHLRASSIRRKDGGRKGESADPKIFPFVSVLLKSEE